MTHTHENEHAERAREFADDAASTANRASYENAQEDSRAELVQNDALVSIASSLVAIEAHLADLKQHLTTRDPA